MNWLILLLKTWRGQRHFKRTQGLVCCEQSGNPNLSQPKCIKNCSQKPAKLDTKEFLEGSKSTKNRPKSTKNRRRKPSWGFLGSKSWCCWGPFDFWLFLWPVNEAKSDPKYSRNAPGQPTRAAKLHKTSSSEAHSQRCCFWDDFLHIFQWFQCLPGKLFWPCFAQVSKTSMLKKSAFRLDGSTILKDLKVWRSPNNHQKTV